MHRKNLSKKELLNGIVCCDVVINHKTSWCERQRMKSYVAFQCFHKFSYRVFGFTTSNNPSGGEATTVVIKNKESIK